MVKERTTIKDVAKEANVTAQTVSRVCRNLGYVAPATKERVLEACRKLNYLPNKSAISLRNGKANSIAVVFDSLKNIYFAIMTDYINDELAKRDYLLQPYFVKRSIIDTDIYLEAVSSGASAVISFLQPTDDLEKTVKRYGVPLMIFGRRTDISDIDYVTTDDVEGGRIAARRIIADGRKKLVFLGDGFGMTCVQDRYDGFEEELKKNGFNPEIVYYNRWAEGDEELETTLENADGIFCFNDIIAYNVFRKINCENKTVVGYDDIQSDLPMPIDLVSVGVDKKKYVEFMVDKLFEKLNKGTSEKIREIYEVRLSERR